MSSDLFYSYEIKIMIYHHDCHCLDLFLFFSRPYLGLEFNCTVTKFRLTRQRA